MASSKLLSDETGHVDSRPRQDKGEQAPVPGTNYTAPRGNGNGHDRDFPISEAYPRDPHPSHSTAHHVAETLREVSWFASVLKQTWPYAVVVISIIFAAGVAWQKLQTAQGKIEAVAERVAGHDKALSDIKEGVAIVRGILEGEQRRAVSAPAPTPSIVYLPAPVAASAPVAPLSAANPPKKRSSKKPPVRSAVSSWSLFH